MKALAELVLELNCPREDIVLWVERRWVLPLQQDGDLVFSDTDIARMQMIIELRRDMGIDDEAMPVILDLLDKLYGVRRQMRDLLTAVGELPEPQRDLLMRRFGGLGDNDASEP
jgi:chaperone modulatory protein CbpM